MCSSTTDTLHEGELGLGWSLIRASHPSLLRHHFILLSKQLVIASGATKVPSFCLTIDSIPYGFIYYLWFNQFRGVELH